MLLITFIKYDRKTSHYFFAEKLFFEGKFRELNDTIDLENKGDNEWE